MARVFDLSQEPCELAPYRWARHRRRDPARLVGVVLHQWYTEVGTEQRHRLRYGEPMALARRALAAPYTISCGVTRAGEPVVALAHPLERYTYSSDAGNAHWISVGVMGLFPFKAERHDPRRHTAVTEALAAAVDSALRGAAQLLMENSLADAPWPVITHRQCANGPGDHVTCPGEAVVEMALRSLPVAEGTLVADPDRLLLPQHGLPWPESWRRHLPKHIVQESAPASGVAEQDLPGLS